MTTPTPTPAQTPIPPLGETGFFTALQTAIRQVLPEITELSRAGTQPAIEPPYILVSQISTAPALMPDTFESQYRAVCVVSGGADAEDKTDQLLVALYYTPWPFTVLPRKTRAAYYPAAGSYAYDITWSLLHDMPGVHPGAAGAHLTTNIIFHSQVVTHS